MVSFKGTIILSLSWSWRSHKKHSGKSSRISSRDLALPVQKLWITCWMVRARKALQNQSSGSFLSWKNALISGLHGTFHGALWPWSRVLCCQQQYDQLDLQFCIPVSSVNFCTLLPLRHLGLSSVWSHVHWCLLKLWLFLSLSKSTESYLLPHFR